MLTTFMLEGRVPGFNGKYHEFKANTKEDGKGNDAMLKWAVNVKMNSKIVSPPYHDDGLINYTAFGRAAELLNELFKLDPKDERRVGKRIILMGRMDPGYIDKEKKYVDGANYTVNEAYIIDDSYKVTKNNDNNNDDEEDTGRGRERSRSTSNTRSTRTSARRRN